MDSVRSTPSISVHLTRAIRWAGWSRWARSAKEGKEGGKRVTPGAWQHKAWMHGLNQETGMGSILSRAMKNVKI